MCLERMNMRESDAKIGILKTLWTQTDDGRWRIHSSKSLTLTPQNGFDADFFKFESEVALFTSSPAKMNIHEVFASLGTTDFLMKQGIVPVVSWVENEDFIRCIGTAFVISCTGY